MTDPHKTDPALRILVALDASPHGLAAIEAATNLASELRVELQGLFVEDTILLRLAALPFTREVDQTSAAIRPLDTAAMEKALRAKAAEIRQAMAVQANQLRVQWSFQVARGEFVQSSLAAATEADLLVLAREGRLSKAAPTTPSVRPTDVAPILVAHDGSSSADRALRTAARLARRLGRQLVILNISEQRDPASRSLTAWLGERELNGSVDNVAVEDVQSLVRAARRWNGRALVVNRDCRLLDESGIGSLVDGLEHPVVLVG